MLEKITAVVHIEGDVHRWETKSYRFDLHKELFPHTTGSVLIHVFRQEVDVAKIIADIKPATVMHGRAYATNGEFVYLSCGGLLVRVPENPRDKLTPGDDCTVIIEHRAD